MNIGGLINTTVGICWIMKYWATFPKKGLKISDQSIDKAINLSDTGARINLIDIGTPDEAATVNPLEYL